MGWLRFDRHFVEERENGVRNHVAARGGLDFLLLPPLFNQLLQIAISLCIYHELLRIG